MVHCAMVGKTEARLSGTSIEPALMSARSKPPFRADHVGSLIRPEALIRARAAAEKGELSAAELASIQRQAIGDVVRMQEDLGFRLVTDGEYNRTFWQRDFLL